MLIMIINTIKLNFSVQKNTHIELTNETTKLKPSLSTGTIFPLNSNNSESLKVIGQARTFKANKNKEK